MLGLPLAFSAPLVLAALAALPALWYLLRITPPRPRQIAFPPLKLILDLKPKEETPARTPWWLLALRLALASLIICAMAGPIWNPLPAEQGARGPLLIVLDDGWPAAPQWDQRVNAIGERISAAARDGRAAALLPVSEGARDVGLTDAAKAAERLRALKPAPYMPDRMPALQAVSKFMAANKDAQIVWFADGTAGGGARPFAEGLVRLAGEGSVHVVTGTHMPVALAGVENAPSALEVRMLRTDARGLTQGQLRAYDLKGLAVGETNFTFGLGGETKARFELPIELRNDIARIEIVNERSAGAVSLLDARWKRRRIGIVSGTSADTAQPLLSPSYYLTRALGPFAEVREARAGSRDPVSATLEDRVAVLVLADIGVVAGPAHDQLARFIEDGGVLIRFAGTRLAGSSDDLVPVRLRRGGRILGGSLSWDKPKPLAPFDAQSPFFGLQGSKEVTVTRQVLAEPEAGLAGKTWAQLADGTPLVTAERRGKGLIVLFHLTADTTWSNLPLSGLFVDMHRRIVGLAGDNGASAVDKPAVDANRVETLAPARTLDGFGALGPPPVTAKPIPANYDGPASADNPPGLYGPVDAYTAINTLSPRDTLEAADFDGLRLDMQPLRPAEPVDLRPAIVAGAFALLLIDALASIWLAGGFGRGGRRRVARGATAALALGLIFGGVDRFSNPAQAQDAQPQASARDMDAARKTRIAYVTTGDANVDEASRAGLSALSHELARRTSLSPAEPNAVDPARDELVFYPLIYWPIVVGRAQPSAAAVSRIASFMKEGGTILFDTRDALVQRPGGAPTPEQLWLRQLLAGVDVPELEPVPRNHVVTKTYYLIDNFIGRTTVGQTWIEALPPDDGDAANRPARAGDSVSPIVITSNDLAAAWALDRSGQPMFPLVPGGARQREMALRGGINLVMYTLTGNYKADQVHVRDLLERLAH
jgi:hypothetical protein